MKSVEPEWAAPPERHSGVSIKPLSTWRAVVMASALISAVGMSWLALWIITSNAIDIIGMDMNVVYGVQQILLGRSLYQPPDVTPYVITQYTPLYYYLAALPAALGRVPASNVLTVTAICRSVSTAIAAGLAGICYAFLRRRAGATRPIAFVATIFIVCGTANWYFAIRPDGLATLLTLASFFVITAPKLSRLRITAAVAFAIAAIMAKQTGAFSVIVLSVFLVSRRQWKHLAFASGAIVVTGVVAFALLSLCGTAIRANVVDGINNGVAWRPALMLAYRPVFYWFAPLIALAGAGVPQLLRRRESPAADLLGVALIISFSMSMVTALKRGSAENYFNEFVILCVFAFVLVFASRGLAAREPVSDQPIVTALQLYVAAFLLVRLGHQVYTTYLYHRISPETRLTSQLGPVDYVRQNLKSDRNVLGFAVGLSNVLPQRMIVPVKELADAAYRRNLVDYSHFRQDVEEGRIQFSIAPNGTYPRSFLGAPLDRFRPIRRFQFYTVFEFDTGSYSKR